MRKKYQRISFFLRILISFFFLFSAFAKLYPIYPILTEGITKGFEAKQLIPMGFSDNIAPYFSRFIIGSEFFLGISILFNNYLVKIIIPLSFTMITAFTIHLFTQLGSEISNCGCAGDLLPMTPLQALIKNIITLIVLTFIYKQSQDIRYKFSNLVILFFAITTIMFAFFPISSQNRNIGTSFMNYIENDDFVESSNYKILCFFDTGCDHCKKAAKSLDSLSNLSNNFPEIHIVFPNMSNDTILTEEMQGDIKNFFDYAGEEWSYQVLPHDNYETTEIDSYHEIIYVNNDLYYENPIIVLYQGPKQIRLFDGIGKNEFDPEELYRLLEKE